MDRVTNTDKWKDDWFLGLNPNAKLVFMFLYENCDDAGFYKLNSSFMEKQLGIPAKYIVISVKALHKSVLISKKVVWIKNFLYHQQLLPLEKNNKEHQKIKLILEKNLNVFDNNADINFILEKVDMGSSRKLRTTRFVKPSIVEFSAYGLEYIEKNKLKVGIEWVDSLYKHYESNGWKVGKNKMANWKAAVSKNAKRESDKNSNEKSTGRIDKLSSANDNINDINVDE